MEFFSNAWNSIVSVHANGFITIGSFLMNNVTMFLVLGVIGYLITKEVSVNEQHFVQDKRRLM
ncbi:hypothetical protein ACFYKX_10105 [Cytobacillus sp. FJAT-54145]|uniref:Uncharacterized protein n=1 Tax=Cytobacillus spartinae TaxID=3299023 RepID=A0ABW6K9Y1_9BACI